MPISTGCGRRSRTSPLTRQPSISAAVKLLSPVANPSKIIGAPINYQAHIDEAKADPDLKQDRVIKTIADWGLFLKATSSLVGPSEGVALRFLDRRNDHELEFAVVIGKPGTNIAYDDALGYVAGYAMGFDMTLRGPELLSWRKSIESYAVLGPWLVTADEIPDPSDIEFKLTVNGEVRQHASTRSLDYDVAKLIAYASTHYTLHPGDIILTGSPEGVAPVKPGDVMVAEARRYRPHGDCDPSGVSGRPFAIVAARSSPAGVDGYPAGGRRAGLRLKKSPGETRG